MRVLHCIPHIQAGGADIGTVELVRALNETSGVEARLCVFRGKEAREEYLRDVIDPILLDFGGSHRRPTEFLRFRIAIRRVVKEWQPDFVHSHLWPACRWVSTALLDMSVNHVWHIHDTRRWLQEPGLRSWLLRRWTNRLIRRLAPRIVSVSYAAARYNGEALGLDFSKFLIASVGVDTEKFAPRAIPRNERTVIGLAAQFRPEKAHAILMEAVKRLRASGVEVELRLAGDGALLEKTKVLCAELGLEDCVQFPGTVKDVPNFLSGLDLFVLPSTGCEGLPLSLLEAMSMNVPVVASAVGGTPEIVRHGDTGYLVVPGDVDALAKGIWHALHNREQTLGMAQNARKLVMKEHATDTVARKIAEVYQSPTV